MIPVTICIETYSQGRGRFDSAQGPEPACGEHVERVEGLVRARWDANMIKGVRKARPYSLNSEYKWY